MKRKFYTSLKFKKIMNLTVSPITNVPNDANYLIGNNNILFRIFAKSSSRYLVFESILSFNQNSMSTLNIPMGSLLFSELFFCFYRIKSNRKLFFIDSKALDIESIYKTNEITPTFSYSIQLRFSGILHGALLPITIDHISINFPILSLDVFNHEQYNFYLTYDPPLSRNAIVPDLEIMDGFILRNRFITENGHIYYVLNRHTDWNSFGGSTYHKNVIGPTGLTPYYSLQSEYIKNHKIIFILHSHTYSGLITINIIGEKFSTEKKFLNQIGNCLSTPFGSQFGMIRQIPIKIDNNKVQSVPLAMKIRFCKSGNVLIFKTVSTLSTDDLNDDFYFHLSQIVFKKPHYRVNPLPYEGNFLLPNGILNIFTSGIIRHFTDRWGSTFNKNQSLVDDWIPSYNAFDQEGNLINMPFNLSKTKLTTTGLNFDHMLTLNLNELDRTLTITCMLPKKFQMENLTLRGNMLIKKEDSHVAMFRNLIFFDEYITENIVMFTIEYIVDGWYINPKWSYQTKGSSGVDLKLRNIEQNEWTMITDQLFEQCDEMVNNSSEEHVCWNAPQHSIEDDILDI